MKLCDNSSVWDFQIWVASNRLYIPACIIISTLMHFFMYNHAVVSAVSDSRPALTERQCTEVSINRLCLNASAESFQAQLQYTEGTCENGETESSLTLINTDIYPLDESYRQCIPINITRACYSARVFHNNEVVGKTEFQQLTLLPCNITTQRAGHGIVINSSTHNITLYEEVPHNTLLQFHCNLGYDFSGINQTRCINGTFEPPLNDSMQATCSEMMLLSCNISNLNLLGRVRIINSSLQDTPAGAVPHNTVLELQCESGCKQIANVSKHNFFSQAHCINGTFQEIPETNGNFCNCSNGIVRELLEFNHTEVKGKTYII